MSCRVAIGAGVGAGDRALSRRPGPRQLDAAKVFDKPVFTEVVPLGRFYKGEEYHQDYAARSPLQSYILFTARPKVDKVRKYYKDRLKGGR